MIAETTSEANKKDANFPAPFVSNLASCILLRTWRVGLRVEPARYGGMREYSKLRTAVCIVYHLNGRDDRIVWHSDLGLICWTWRQHDHYGSYLDSGRTRGQIAVVEIKKRTLAAFEIDHTSNGLARAIIACEVAVGQPESDSNADRPRRKVHIIRHYCICYAETQRLSGSDPDHPEGNAVVRRRRYLILRVYVGRSA